MARTTPKKPNGVTKAAKTADISSFFRKPSVDQSIHQNCNGHGDVKPDIISTNGRAIGSLASRKGKEKAVGGDTSADPVVISSDEEGEAKNGGANRSKRQKIAEVPTRPTEVFDVPSSPGAGPSRSPSVRSCSPKPPPPTTNDVADGDRPSFAGVPQFQPPPNWPHIINTAEDLDEDGDDDRIDVDGDIDADSQHPGMFDEDDEAQDPGNDGDGAEDDEMGSEVPGIEQPEEENLAAVPRGGSIDLTMEWDEGDDEGMGMEEPDDYDDPPIPSKKQSGNGKGGRGGKGKQVDKCPVCSTSMKGKKDNVRALLYCPRASI
jgi:DNA cross-link repair 1A protein